MDIDVCALLMMTAISIKCTGNQFRIILRNEKLYVPIIINPKCSIKNTYTLQY